MANPVLTFDMTPMPHQGMLPRHQFYKDVTEAWTLAVNCTPALPAGSVPVALSQVTAVDKTTGLAAPTVLEADDQPIIGNLVRIGVHLGTKAHVYAIGVVVTCTGNPPVILSETLLMIIL